MLVAAALAGLLSSMIVSRTTIDSTAASTALFMDNFLSSHIQSLAHSDTLPADAQAALDRLLNSDAFDKRFPHLEIWKPDGLIVYSTSHELIGQRFTPPPGTVAAFSGQVAARYADLTAQEHVSRNFQEKYLEIYTPVREQNSARIIAVAEIHELPEVIQRKLFYVRFYTWLITAGITLLVMVCLYSIVYRGNKTIRQQQMRLQNSILEAREISDQNLVLRERSQRASSRLAELNAKYLRNVGAELHDGPAQLIGLASLKVEHIRRADTAEERSKELQALELVLSDALRDIKTISKGLILPKIEEMSLCEIIKLVVRTHEQRTKTKVTIGCGSIDVPVSHAVKICVYRFVQEGLNNAFKHADGIGQAVTCTIKNSVLVLTVKDKGKVQADNQKIEDMGLGLIAMYDRVESLGGSVDIHHCETGGTNLTMNLGLAGRNQDG